MPIIEGLEQGTDEWHVYRRDHVMATDASVIAGTNPFLTQLELWEEKNLLRPPREVNDAMKRGQELEAEARELFIQSTGIKVKPCVYQHNTLEWMAASLDGLSECGRVVLEIKCPGHPTHNDALNGHIKEYYLTQMDHQLNVTEAKICFYATYRPEHQVKFDYFDHESNIFQRNMLIDQCNQFWLNLYFKIPPKAPWKLEQKNRVA